MFGARILFRRAQGAATVWFGYQVKSPLGCTAMGLGLGFICWTVINVIFPASHHLLTSSSFSYSRSIFFCRCRFIHPVPICHTLRHQAHTRSWPHGDTRLVKFKSLRHPSIITRITINSHFIPKPNNIIILLF